ncbi:hypothetical protein HPB47_013609 [Ixodes persulcatus]|uniref:Uncharacterized protein n=1 Tax=Ixodes persulcatus TaxID=34615 RepID=A0AC60QY48_IXOPE|nr:hypothetical protein HPB47_013609 [Ixodes persulcatus]
MLRRTPNRQSEPQEAHLGGRPPTNAVPTANRFQLLPEEQGESTSLKGPGTLIESRQTTVTADNAEAQDIPTKRPRVNISHKHMKTSTSDPSSEGATSTYELNEDMIEDDDTEFIQVTYEKNRNTLAPQFSATNANGLDISHKTDGAQDVARSVPVHTTTRTATIALNQTAQTADALMQQHMPAAPARKLPPR